MSPQQKEFISALVGCVAIFATLILTLFIIHGFGG
jgi:hypothetical protein